MNNTKTPPDPQAWLDRVLLERDRAKNDLHRAMLSKLHQHLEAEFNNRLDDTMATLVEDAQFRAWCGAANGPGGEPTIIGREQIRESYRIPMEDLGGFPPTELVIERFLVSDDGIAMDGQIKRLVSGAALGQPGFQPDRLYLTEARMGLLISFRDGLMIGEDMYWDPRVEITPVGSAKPQE